MAKNAASAGGRLWIPPHDVGDHVTQFTASVATPTVEATGISHTRRRRESSRLADTTFSIDGMFDDVQLDTLDGEADFFRARRGADDQPAEWFRGRLQPEASIRHELGDIIRLSANGTCDYAPAEGRLLLNRRAHSAAGAGTTDYRAAGQRWDRGAGALPGGTVQLVVALDAADVEPANGSIEVELLHSNAAGGGYAEVSAASQVVIRGDTALGVYTWSGAIAAVRRYLAVRVGRSASVTKGDLTFSVMVFVIP